MRKFVIFVLICGCGLFFGGILLALSALALGADIYKIPEHLAGAGLLRIVNNSRFWYNDRNRANFAFWEDFELPYMANPADTEELPELPGLPAPGQYAIKNIHFSFALGDVRIRTGDDFELIYGNDNTRRLYTEAIKDDSWIINTNRVRRPWWNLRQNDIRLTVVLPRDFVAETMFISMGAGNVEAARLYAQMLDLDVGLGHCRVDSLYAEEVKINVGVGYLAAGRFSARQAKLDVGLGALELSLAQPLEQYRCQIEVGLGNVQLGGSNYSGVANVNNGPADAPYNLDMKCGLGSITIL
jgi:hypothetical protein